jgi:hypothetical protein
MHQVRAQFSRVRTRFTDLLRVNAPTELPYCESQQILTCKRFVRSTAEGFRSGFVCIYSATKCPFVVYPTCVRPVPICAFVL